MPRGILVLLLCAPAALAQGAPENPCRVQQEGALQPRKRLRYRGRVQVIERLRLELSQEVRREFADRPSQKQAGPLLVLDVEIAPDRFEGGTWFFGVRIKGASASGGTASAEQAETLRKAVTSLKGLFGDGAVTEDGSALEIRWNGVESLPPDAQGLAEQVRTSLAGIVAPLPRVPMGEDGRWVVALPREKRPFEPVIEELSFRCSVIGDGASILGTGKAEAKEAVEMPPEPGSPRIVRTKLALEVERRTRVLPRRLFPAGISTTTIASHYTAGDVAFVDRQVTVARLHGPDEPSPPSISVVGTGEGFRAPIEYTGAVTPRDYRIVYGVRETVSSEGRVEKRGQPRTTATVRCTEWTDLDPLASASYAVAWSVVSAAAESEPGRAVLDYEAAARKLQDLEGGGAYGRSCEEVIEFDLGKPSGSVKRPRLAPRMWLAVPDGSGREVEEAAERLCDAIEWSMLPVPPPTRAKGEAKALARAMGKGGSWRHEDLVPVAGTKPLERLLEYAVTEVSEDSFTVTVQSRDGRAPLGPAAPGDLPEGAKATLVACSSRRTGSWTIATDLTLPAKANVEDVLDLEYTVVEPDGTRRKIAHHIVRSVTIEAR